MWCCITAEPKQLQAQLQQLQLGLLDANQQFQPAPVSLTPWQLSPQQWQQAQQLSQLLGRLLLAASQDRQWLQQALQGLPATNLFSRLAALPQALNPALPPVPVMRHDMMLDNSGQWRWVESNTIAAGMGPLNQQLGRLPALAYQQLAANPALQQQALFAAATALRQQYDSAMPVIVFVIEPAEDNLFDQQLLQQALQQLGARVQRLTLQQLTLAQLSRHNRLQLHSGDEADLVYYRTGYNHSDYASAAQLALRATLQQAALLQCPDIPLQLAGSKWVQAALSTLLLSGQHEKLLSWGFNPAQCTRLRQAVMPMYALTAANTSQTLHDIANGWLLKSQQEGGGGIWRGDDATQQLLAHAHSGLMLMAPIQHQLRTEPVWLLRQGKLSCQLATVSELGVFSVGIEHHYGGYLLRSKAAGELAGGVHRGGAVLDTIALSRSQSSKHRYKSLQVRYDDSVINHLIRETNDHSTVRRPAGTDVCCIKY